MARRSRKLGGLVDSGLVVVVFITTFMLGIAVYCLVFVKYEWCHVLFRNNTVGARFYDRFNRECSSITTGY